MCLLTLIICPHSVWADTPIVYLNGHTESVTAVDWSAETGTLVTGSLDATVRMWDVAGRRSFAVAHGHADAISSLTLSRDGRLVASGSLDGVVLLSGVPRRQPIDRWPIDERATTLAIAPDGAALAVGYESGAITLHDANSGEATARFATSGGPIRRLMFDVDGAALIVTTADGRIERWSTAGQQQGAIRLDAGRRSPISRR
jgi:WD40 repeat protein